MKKGLFISIEGTDGSGKTTQINLLKLYLTEKGHEVVLIREPGGTKISEAIRTIILDEKNNEMGCITELLLYASSRAQLIHEVIRPAIDEGKIIICDRFIDSSYVYQGYGRGIDTKIIENVNKAAIDGIMPDITIFFDIDVQTALKRRLASTKADRIEKENIDFHTRVYNGYKELASLYPHRIKSIDASRTKREIHQDVTSYINEIL